MASQSARRTRSLQLKLCILAFSTDFLFLFLKDEEYQVIILKIKIFLMLNVISPGCYYKDKNDIFAPKMGTVTCANKW